MKKTSNRNSSADISDSKELAMCHCTEPLTRIIVIDKNTHHSLARDGDLTDLAQVFRGTKQGNR